MNLARTAQRAFSHLSTQQRHTLSLAHVSTPVYSTMTTATSAIKQVKELGMPWATQDPFLFCVHHNDHYPKGDGQLGVDPDLLKGHHMGSDFGHPDGWSMYHGRHVPGFPQHPHRGFETITVARDGLLDHADSLNAKGRFGDGDTQWMTAGKGVVHAEMFPLLHDDKDNHLELFQIWLNLPKRSKFVPPDFKMLWGENTLHITYPTPNSDATTRVSVIAGDVPAPGDGDKGLKRAAQTPPKESWAFDQANDVSVLALKMTPGAVWTLPAARTGSKCNRSLYFFEGKSVNIAGRSFTTHKCIEVDAAADISLSNTGDDLAEILVLQGVPIDEPVAQHGPFVMNTRAEIMEAFQDYQRTEFGGWPHDSDGPVHGDKSVGRFALYPDGRKEFPPSAASVKQDL